MHFASPIPWWLTLAVAVALVGLAVFSYRRPSVPPSGARRWTLAAIRALTLGIVVWLVCRPLALLPPVARGPLTVPILVDVSASMRVPDADGAPRLERARDLLRRTLLPSLSARFTAAIYAFGDGVTASDIDHLGAAASRTDIGGALRTIRDRYRGARVPGIVLLSDGGNTEAVASPDGEPPVFAIGLGSTAGPRDREVLGLAAGEPGLDQAVVDLRVVTVSRGFGRTPFDVRLFANGSLLDTRRLVPAADEAPQETVFVVTPDPLAPTVYRAEIAPDAEEPVRENNQRSVLVGPAGRTRRVLIVEGAPGFDHSFLQRALAADPGLEIDVVTRKGTSDTGERTFAVQAAGGRAGLLTGGFPSTREALYGYDLLLLANVEGDALTRSQWTVAADFVGRRGGGLLVMGGRSFGPHGMSGTALEEVLPVELGDRRGGSWAAAAADGASSFTLVPTAEGESHPVVRLDGTAEGTRRRWAALPALASTAALGAPRPGASVLAVTPTPGGVFPVLAVQRYGRGRAMVFGGEASWRWRMLTPSTDRTYEHFWRQAVRWLAVPTPDPVTVGVPEDAEPGDRLEIPVEARDASFAVVPEATIDVTVTAPDGGVRPVAVRRGASDERPSVAAFVPDRAGLYRIRAAATRGATPLGVAERWFEVGGQSREFAQPRLNTRLLEHLARATGGRAGGAREAADVIAGLQAAPLPPGEPVRRDLWHQPWVFALVLGLLAAEWVLRRRWGLR